MRAEKSWYEKNLKKFWKSIDKGRRVWYTLQAVSEREAARTLKIKPRDKKRNPRFDGKEPSRRVFKSTFQTVIYGS